MSEATNTISIEDFKAEARTFLDASAKKKPEATAFVWGQGSDDVAVFDEKYRYLCGCGCSVTTVYTAYDRCLAQTPL